MKSDTHENFSTTFSDQHGQSSDTPSSPACDLERDSAHETCPLSRFLLLEKNENQKNSKEEDSPIHFYDSPAKEADFLDVPKPHLIAKALKKLQTRHSSNRRETETTSIFSAFDQNRCDRVEYPLYDLDDVPDEPIEDVLFKDKPIKTEKYSEELEKTNPSLKNSDDLCSENVVFSSVEPECSNVGNVGFAPGKVKKTDLDEADFATRTIDQKNLLPENQSEINKSANEEASELNEESELDVISEANEVGEVNKKDETDKKNVINEEVFNKENNKVDGGEKAVLFEKAVDNNNMTDFEPCEEGPQESDSKKSAQFEQTTSAQFERVTGQDSVFLEHDLKEKETLLSDRPDAEIEQNNGSVLEKQDKSKDKINAVVETKLISHVELTGKLDVDDEIELTEENGRLDEFGLANNAALIEETQGIGEIDSVNEFGLTSDAFESSSEMSEEESISQKDFCETVQTSTENLWAHFYPDAPKSEFDTKKQTEKSENEKIVFDGSSDDRSNGTKGSNEINESAKLDESNENNKSNENNEPRENDELNEIESLSETTDLANSKPQSLFRYLMAKIAPPTKADASKDQKTSLFSYDSRRRTFEEKREAAAQNDDSFLLKTNQSAPKKTVFEKSIPGHAALSEEFIVSASIPFSQDEETAASGLESVWDPASKNVAQERPSVKPKMDETSIVFYEEKHEDEFRPVYHFWSRLSCGQKKKLSQFLDSIDQQAQKEEK